MCLLNMSAFTHFLSKHGIASRYPHLVSFLNHSFRISNMPPILHTTIHPIHPSIKAHGSFARDHILEETAHGRMLGPFTRSEMESICGGAFHCLPYLVVVCPGNAGKPDKLRLCINLLKSGSDEAGRNVLSVNEHIDPDDFVTRFDLAMIMADKVITCPASALVVKPPPHHHPHHRESRACAPSSGAATLPAHQPVSHRGIIPCA
jgi:hypothetical protein